MIPFILGLCLTGSILAYVCMGRICQRCNGSGFVNVRDGNIKRCPFCNGTGEMTT